MDRLCFDVDHSSDSSVLLAGDWAGDLAWAKQAVKSAHERGVSLILQLGDFEVMPGSRGKKFLLKLDEECEKYGVDIAVTLGNHEDWARVENLWANPKNRDCNDEALPLALHTRHIRILPRVYRFELNSVRFLSFGGAASVDLDVRTEGRDWWPQEAISEDQVAKAIAGGPVDVMLSHESPNPPYAVEKVTGMLNHNPLGFGKRGLAYSALSRERLTEVFEALKPSVLAHGHMHVEGARNFAWRDADRTSTVISLSDQFTAGNLFPYSLEPQ